MTADEKIILARIDERLGAHVDLTARWQGETTERIKGLESTLAHDNVRIDRCEQREKFRGKALWLAIAAAFAALVSVVKGWLAAK